MKQRYLLPFNDYEDSLKAVNYAVKMLKPEDEVTLYRVQPPKSAVCELDDPSLIPAFREKKSNFCASANNNDSIISQSMEKAIKMLMQKGMPSKNIINKLEKQTCNLENHIIQEAKSGNYDVILMGEKSEEGVRRLLKRNITGKVLKRVDNVTIAVVKS